MNNEELILQTLMDLKQDLGQIKTSVEKVPDLEKRVSSLEATRDQEAGARRRTAIISNVISTVVGFFIAIFTGHH
jgi:hypothetical protein